MHIDGRLTEGSELTDRKLCSKRFNVGRYMVIILETRSVYPKYNYI